MIGPRTIVGTILATSPIDELGSISDITGTMAEGRVSYVVNNRLDFAMLHYVDSAHLPNVL